MDGSDHQKRGGRHDAGLLPGPSVCFVLFLLLLLVFFDKSGQEIKQRRKQLEKVWCWGKKEIHEF